MTTRDTLAPSPAPHGAVYVPVPPFARAFALCTLYASCGFGLLYASMWAGSGWIRAGAKLQAARGSGEPLKGFSANAVKIPEGGHPAIAYDWYRQFLQFMLDQGWYTWFAKVIMWGELLIGVALILGAFTGIAAFAGGFMNWNFIMAGSASINGFLLVLAIVLFLAWKVAGWYGLDPLASARDRCAVDLNFEFDYATTCSAPRLNHNLYEMYKERRAMFARRSLHLITHGTQ